MSSDSTATATQWNNLSDFKRDILVAIRRLDCGNDTPYGLGIKRELEAMRDEEVNHGRLYPNLDQLIEAGLVERGQVDRRTNRYDLTDRGMDALVARARILDDLVTDQVVATDGGLWTCGNCGRDVNPSVNPRECPRCNTERDGDAA